MKCPLCKRGGAFIDSDKGIQPGTQTAQIKHDCDYPNDPDPYVVATVKIDVAIQQDTIKNTYGRWGDYDDI